jgi:hypothetical protein
MRRRLVLCIAVLVGSFGTGCPETYGKGGLLDQAMHRDVMEEMEEVCADGRPRRQICDDPQAPISTCPWRCP